MKVENKELITVRTYLNDIGKSHQCLLRHLHAGSPLPGIEEYYHLKPNVHILKKGADYKVATKKVKGQKYILQEK